MPQPHHLDIAMRPAQPHDIQQLKALFAELHVPVAGSTTASAQAIFINEALYGKGAVLVVAEKNSKLVGIGMGVLEPTRFWKRLLLKRPSLAIARLAALVRRRLKHPAREAGTGPATESCGPYLSGPSGRHWGESNPQLAHVLLVIVKPELRGSGAGIQLFTALLDKLAARGARRFDSRIAKHNVASVKMCYRLGIRVEDAPGTYFVTADLPRSRS